MVNDNPLGVTLGLDFTIAAIYERRAYHAAFEQAIDEKISWRMNSIHKRAAELPIAERVDFLEQNYPYRWILSFTQELRAHVIVGALSFLESQLIYLCENISHETTEVFKRPVSDKLDNCKRYLLSQGIDKPNEPTWNKIRICQKLRNSLIHNGLDINFESPDKVSELAHEIEGIVEEKEHGYILERKACENVLRTVEDVLKEIRESAASKWH